MSSPTTASTQVTSALKEWAVVIQALNVGETILLLRKGGIREENGRFEVKCDRIWLFPTYEHQQPDLLKSPYGDQIQPVSPGWHPDALEIRAWADITHIFPLREIDQVTALTPHHIWSPSCIQARYDWKPQQPLYGLLLRVHRLPSPVSIPYQTSYGGCRSWIDLPVPADPTTTHPVLEEAAYSHNVDAIMQALSNS
jgi:hypothetical protein